MAERSVLIVCYGKDDHVDLVRSELDRLRTPFFVFDTAVFPSSRADGEAGTPAVGIGFTVDDGRARTRLFLPDGEQSGDAVGAVLFRHVRLPQAPHVTDPEARRMAESEMRWTLEGALAAIDGALWMNDPHANRLARNKLLQLRLASRLGFSVPDTLVSADPAEIRARWRAWNGRMIAKLAGSQIIGESVDSQYVVYTAPLSAEDLADDGALAACPAIYQRRIDKAYELRVTVVGDRLFACRIRGRGADADPVDWRTVGYGGLEMEPYEPGAALSARCLALARALGLEVGGIDLIVTPEGDTVFLEINAAGQWAWMEQATGLPIAAAVAARLSGALRSSATGAEAGSGS